jgi:hypothetical protein
MMSCKEVAELSSDYLDQELSTWRRFWLRLHMLLCRQCRELVQGIRSLLDVSSELKSPGDTARYEDLATRLSEGSGELPPGDASGGS